MASTLPEELLKEIFDVLLHVPDHLFNDTSPRSPFASITSSSSTLLLICKRWLRICTPILYGTVILRSPAQIIALNHTIEANSRLAKLVRRLRLEGTVPATFPEIAKRMSAIEDICLVVDKGYNSDVSTLIKLFRSFNPRKASLTRIKNLGGGDANTFHKTLGRTISRWTNLLWLCLPQQTAESDDLAMIDTLITAAMASLNIRTVILPAINFLVVERLINHRPQFLGLLQRQPPPQLVISIPDASTSDETMFTQQIQLAQRRLVILDDPNKCTQAHRLYQQTERAQVLWTGPLDTATASVNSHIWREIVRAAIRPRTKSPSLYKYSYLDFSDLDLTTARSLLFSTWSLSEHVLAVLAERLHVKNEHHATMAVQRLKASLSLGLCVRHMRFDAWFPSCIQLLSTATGLQSLTANIWLKGNQPQNAFSAIRRKACGIRYLRLNSYSTPMHWHLIQNFDDSQVTTVAYEANEVDGAELLNELEELRVLVWTMQDIPFVMAPTNDHVLQNLVDLTTTVESESFLCWIVKCPLPHLTRFTLRKLAQNRDGSSSSNPAEASKGLSLFLWAHGSKLSELTLNGSVNMAESQLLLCQNLLSLRIDSTLSSELLANTQHHSVKTLIIPGPIWQPFEGWRFLLEALDKLSFPNLETIVAEDLDFRALAESYVDGPTPWLEEATERLKARGVTMTDKLGTTWRSRLRMYNVLRRSSRLTRR
ncbi:hypothetical protein BKA62DRAFT_753342 [Auriculariales sp. MPI-PUGE-AT-0066]|nr:hypothetical protein BKA62DRAFT_753342 [Auriculariales sp. MPI-PUGE-AT-0066]